MNKTDIAKVLAWAQKQEKLKDRDINSLVEHYSLASKCRLERIPTNCCIIQNTSAKTCEGCGHKINIKYMS